MTGKARGKEEEEEVLNWVDDVITPQIDERQFGGLAGTGTTDALVEMVHTWCEATDKPGTFVRVLLVDYSKAFDHINHEILIAKLYGMGLPAYLVRWMAAFLIDRQQSIKIGDTVSSIGYLSDNIETIQKRCLRTIFPGNSYDEARSISNLPTLFERRTKLCQSYFRKMHNADHKLNNLLPNQRNISYDLRTYNTLPVPLARTDRFRRSLIPWGLANWQQNVL